MASTPSAMKRKRESNDRYPAKSKWKRSVLQSLPTGITSSASHVHTLPSGSLVAFHEKKVYLFPGVVFRGEEPDFSTSPQTALLFELPQTSTPFVRTVSSVGTPQSQLEIVIGSSTGKLQFWKPFSGESSTYVMDLPEDDNVVVDISTEERSIYMLTQTGHVYVVQRNGYSTDGFLFQRSVSFMSGLLRTGAKLLGVSLEQRKERALKLLLVPSLNCLLSVGSTLTVWGQYSTVGRETAQADVPLTKVLKLDIANSSGRSIEDVKLHLCDCVYLGADIATQTVSVFVLSAVADTHRVEQVDDDDTDENEGARDVVATLYLHALRISVQPLTDSPSAVADTSACSIRQRVLLTEEAIVPAGGSRFARLLPRLFCMDPAWRVYVSWLHAGLEPSTPVLQAVQVDVYHPSTASSSTTSLQAAAVSCAVSVPQIGHLQCVQGVDGVVVTHLPPQSVSIFTPPLAVTSATDEVDTQTAETLSVSGTLSPAAFFVPQTQVGLSADRKRSEAFHLLSAVVSGQRDLQSEVGALRDAFLCLSAADVRLLVQQVSDAVLNRHPTGQYWGSIQKPRNTASGSAGLLLTNPLHEFQFAHRMVQEKVTSHALLVHAVSEADGLRFAEVHALLQLNHAKVSLAAAVAEAVEDRMERLSEGGLESAVALFVQALSSAVLRVTGLTQGHIDAQGLTSYDQFYAEVSKVYEILTAAVDALTQHLPSALQSLNNSAVQVQTVLQSLSLLVSLLQLSLDTTSSAGASTPPPAPLHTTLRGASAALHQAPAAQHRPTRPLSERRDLCIHLLQHPALRTAVVDLTQTCSALLQQLPATLPPPQQHFLGGAGGAGCERMLVQLCELVLGSYHTEARLLQQQQQQEDEDVDEEVRDLLAVEAMDDVAWKLQCNAAKDACLALLLRLHMHRAAFTLAAVYLHAPALCEAAAQDLPQHLSAFEEVLQRRGGRWASALQGARAMLAHQYLSWLLRCGQHQRLLRDCQRLSALRAVATSFLSPSPDEEVVEEVRDSTFVPPYSPERSWLLLVLCGRTSSDTISSSSSSYGAVQTHDACMGAAQAGLCFADSRLRVQDAKTALSLAKLNALVAAQRRPASVTTSPEQTRLLRTIERESDLLSLQESLSSSSSSNNNNSNAERLQAWQLATQAVTQLQTLTQTQTQTQTLGRAAEKESAREDCFLMAARTLILLGMCVNTPNAELVVTQTTQSLWATLLRWDLEAVVWEVAAQTVQSQREEAVLRSRSLLFAVLQDGLVGVSEGRVSREHLLPLHAGRYAALLQEVLGQAQVQSELRELALRVERVQTVLLAIPALVRAEDQQPQAQQ